MECGFIDRDHFRNDLDAEGLFRGLLGLFDLKDEVKTIYRVVRRDGTQIGAYRVRSNAWRAYLSVDGDAVILAREGRDVTADFVDEFGRDVPREGPPEIEEGYEPVAHGEPSEGAEPEELLPEADTEEVDAEVPA